MTRTTKAFLTLAFIALALPLGGCESVDHAMSGMRERIDAIHMPTFGGQQEAAPQDGESREARAAAAMEAPEKGPAALEPQKMEGAPQPTATTGKDCPPVTIVKDLASLHQFTNPARPTPDSRISSVVIKDLKTSCTKNENNIAVQLDLTFEGRLGPRARVAKTDEPTFAYPYFVAITTKDGNIAAKEVFAATITYQPEYETATAHENMRQIIPLTGDYAKDYEILVGFQLGEGELAYNRALSEGPAASDVVPEDYIESATPAAPATAKPMTVIPQKKPPVPKAVKASVAKVEEVKIENAVDAAPAPATVVSPVAADQPEEPETALAPVTNESEAAGTGQPQDTGEPEQAPAQPSESTEGKSAILEENAIIPTDKTTDPVNELQNPY